MTAPLGARVEPDGVSFAVWAPLASRIDLVLEENGSRTMPLRAIGDGLFTCHVPDVGSGVRYRFRVDGAGPFPDPASRFQPEGVHGPSAVVDPTAFPWTDDAWRGVPLEDLVVYELHVGTFSPEGTFAGVRRKLPEIRDLGVTAIELMPVADFAGDRNWGYDGVALFAPARCYGAPDDLRAVVDEAHRCGLGVLLDVVYNHLGPDGAYLRAVSPPFFSDRHHTPWGDAVDLDGRHAERVRALLIQNATQWIRDYHFDGLRLDATHALFDESPRHVLSEIAEAARGAAPHREVLVIAEDHRNLAAMVEPESAGGIGLDGVWADDLHHQFRRALAGDHEGYFQDFTGSTEDIAETLRRGWFFCGQPAPSFGGPRGTDPGTVARRHFVVCLQNHDQIGNRAFGDRLHHAIDLAAYHAACALLLLAPETPLLFMGQEWAATSPFLFFTDHHAELGRLVTRGRRREFAAFTAFREPEARERIPDPQAVSTFERSRLDWDERALEPHARTLRLHRELLRLRRTMPPEESGFDAFGVGDDAVALRRGLGTDGALVVARLRGEGPLRIEIDRLPAGVPTVVLDTGAAGSIPVHVRPDGIHLSFPGPGAVVLRF